MVLLSSILGIWNPDDNDVAELQTSPDFGQSLYINKNLDFKKNNN